MVRVRSNSKAAGRTVFEPGLTSVVRINDFRLASSKHEFALGFPFFYVQNLNYCKQRCGTSSPTNLTQSSR